MRCVIIGGRNLCEGIPDRWAIEYSPSVPLRNGHAGCLQAHRNVWTTITEPTIILEDDAVIDITRNATPWPDCDVLYLGGQPTGWTPEPGAHPIPPNSLLWRTHAYRLNAKAARHLLAQELPLPWDMATTWRTPLDCRLLWPPIAGQSANHSSTLHIDLPLSWYDGSKQPTCQTEDTPCRTT